MNRPENELRMLAPDSFRQVLSRRAIFQAGTAAAGLAILSACGNEKKATDNSVGGDCNRLDIAAVADGTPSSGFSNVVNRSSGTLSMYTWGDYNDPELIGPLAEADLGVSMKVDYYPSNQDLVTKLSASNGNSGFDIVVPTGPFIPQMIQKGLLEKFDLTKLPNIVNVDPLYLGQAWDPCNEYSVCKDWGSTGWIYNAVEVGREINTWNDFLDVCMNEASGNCSVLDTPGNITGLYFWANGINWTTEKAEDLDACETFLVDEFASHIKAFDSYPSTKLAEGSYLAAMAWNGDARQAFLLIADAGGNPDDWKWGLGAPATELWMDNYSIPTGAPNSDAAHAWINWLLTPEVSIRDLNYHGYHSGMQNIDELLAELVPDLERGDMIFFDASQVATMETGAVNSAQDRLVDILNKVKAKAGG